MKSLCNVLSYCYLIIGNNEVGRAAPPLVPSAFLETLFVLLNLAYQIPDQHAQQERTERGISENVTYISHNLLRFPIS